MYIPFSEEFEHEYNGQVYFVRSSGCREIDCDGVQYTELTELDVFDENEEPVEEGSEAYNEIEEYVLYDRNYEVEEHGFSSDWADEEEFPVFGSN